MKIGILPSTFTCGITAASRYIMHRCVLGVFTIKPIGEPGAITFKSLEPKPAMATGEVVLDFIHMETIHCVVSKTFTIHTESSQEMPSVHMKPLKTNHCRLHYILCAIVSIKKSEESNVSCRKHECRPDMLCGDFRIAFKVG